MSMSLAKARGDYVGDHLAGYRRGMDQGDPGLFGFLGSVAKRAAGAAVGFATGGVGGAIAGAGLSRTQRAELPRSAMPGSGAGLFQPTPGDMGMFGPMVRTPGITGAVQRFLPGGETGMMPAGAAPTGYHYNKTGYFLRSGVWIPPMSKLVKNRRRNPGNMRATARGMARVVASKKAMGMLSRITIRKPPCGCKK